ncbi:hypothetical protein GCM10020227_20700 [Streptomyces flavovirens]
MVTTLDREAVIGVSWKGTKNINKTCCELTHKPHTPSPARVMSWSVAVRAARFVDRESIEWQGGLK